MKAAGVSALMKHQSGKGKLSVKDAILAKCAECMNRYMDGKVTCGLKRCPLYPFMPYKDEE